MKRKPEISISVNAYDCSGMRDGHGTFLAVDPTADELLAIAKVFVRASEAILNHEHGTVNCERNLASVGIDWGGPYDEKTGLPVLEKIKVRK